MNVEVDQWDACDIKDSSFTFVKQNHSKCQHFFARWARWCSRPSLAVYARTSLSTTVAWHFQREVYDSFS